MSLDHSPISIVGQRLVNAGLSYWGDTAAQAGRWPLWLSTLPTTPNTPKEAVGLFGPDGRLQGRLMGTGEMVRYPGLQVRVMGPDYNRAWRHLQSIYAVLTEATKREEVVMDDPARTYLIHTVTPRTDIIELGVDNDTDLQHFSANFIVRISKVA